MWHPYYTFTNNPAAPAPTPDVAVKTGTGGIDPKHGKRKTIFKPTGLDYRERKAQQIVEQVAKRQVEQPTLDDFQQQEELLREFEAEGLALENRFLMALAAERDRLITEEIATLIRIGQQVEEEMAIILLAASE